MTKTDPERKYGELLEFTGPKAIVARAFVEAFLSGETKLKAVQMMAVESAEEYGLLLPTDKPNMTSPVGKHLRDAAVFMQFEKRTTKGYVLEAGPRLEEFSEFLDNDIDYGTRLTGTFSEDLGRHELIEHLEKYGCVRANQTTNKIPPKVYKVLGERAARGDLDVIYVPKGAVVATKHNGQKVMIDYYVH